MDAEMKKKIDQFMDATAAKVEALGRSSGDHGVELAQLRKDLTEETQRLTDRIRERNVSLAGSELPDNGKKFSWAKAVNAITSRDWTGAEHEQQIFKEANALTRTATTMVGANMGFTVPTEIAKEVLMPAQARMVVGQLGATIYNDLRGELPFPEVTSEPELSWSPENRAATATDITVGDNVMRPKTGKMLLKLSNKLNYQTAGTAEQLILEQIRKGSARGMDTICLTGTGSSSQPLGILNHPSIVSNVVAVGSAGGRLTIDKVAQLIAEVQDRDYEPTGLLSHPRVISGMKRERVDQYTGQPAGEGQPIMINPIMTDQILSGILGLTIAHTTKVPKNGAKAGTTDGLAKAIVGDWKEFKVGNWGGMQLKSSMEAGDAFSKNELWIAVFVDMDTFVAHAGAFEICADAAALESLW